MSRPIDGDGTINVSTGRPGRDHAPAVAEPPARPISPGSATVAITATNTGRDQAHNIVCANVTSATHLFRTRAELPVVDVIVFPLPE